MKATNIKGEKFWILVLAAAGLGLLQLPASATNHTVTLEGHAFKPKVLTIQAGDTVTWINEQRMVRHNVQADDGSFRCAYGCDHLGGNGSPLAGPWQVSLTFNDPGKVPYHCLVHLAYGMTGTIIIEGDPIETEPEPGSETTAIDFGHGGSWYDPDRDGQGFSMEVVPDADSTKAGTGTLVAYWFTFAKGTPGGPGRQRWFQGVGPINGTEALLDVYRVTGGVFDDTTPVASEIVGTAVASFSSCTEGTFAYSLDLDGDGSEESANEIALTRLTPDVLCEEMVAE